MHAWYRNRTLLILMLISFALLISLAMWVSPGMTGDGPVLTATPSSTATATFAGGGPQAVSGRIDAGPNRVGAGVDQRLTNSSTPQNETSIAGDPNNSSVLVGGINDYSILTSGFAGPGVVYSSDAGATWTHHATGVPLPSGFNNRGGDPSVDFDSQGHVFYGSIGLSAGANVFSSNNGIFVSRSNDGGANWNPMSTVASNVWPGSGLVNFEDKPYLTVDHYAGSPYQDNIYISWTRFYSGSHPDGGVGGGDIMVGRSSDGGSTWSVVRLTVPLNAGTGAVGSSFVHGSEPEVASNGDVYVTFWFGGRIEVWKSVNGGVSFAQQTQPFGATFGTISVPTPLPNQTFRVNAFPNIETNPALPGHVYVSVADDPDNTAGLGDDADIVFARSTNGGANWGPKIRLNDDPLNVTQNQIFPWMAVSKRGAIHVIWYDTRNDVGNHDMDVYGTFSVDGGATFCPNFRVTDANFNPDTGQFAGNTFFGDYNGIGTTGRNTFHALWTDTRTGGAPEQEIYYDLITCEVSQLMCPPDSLLAGGQTVPNYVLSGFKITNVGTGTSSFDYALSSSGPGTLNDNGNPASLGGTTPVLNPGQSYMPPAAALSLPVIHAPATQKTTYVVSPTGNTLWADTCCTLIDIEPPLPVAFQGLEAIRVDRGVELRWTVVEDVEVLGYNVYRSSGDDEPYLKLNNAGLLPNRIRSYVDTEVDPNRDYLYRIGAVEPEGETLSLPITVASGPFALQEVRLEQNEPNPFNPVTTIRFVLPSAQDVRLEIYNSRGGLVRRLIDGGAQQGVNEVAWDGRNADGRQVGTGVYFYRLTAGRLEQTRKMVLIK